MVPFAIAGLTFALVLNLWLAYWPGADTAEWERHWGELDDLDRAWLNVASRSPANRVQLEERGELELALGIGRREWRRRARFLLLILIPFFLALGLMATDFIGDRFAETVFSTYALVSGIVASLRAHRAKRRYRDTQAEYLAAAGTVRT